LCWTCDIFADIQTCDILKINNIYLKTVYIFLCVSLRNQQYFISGKYLVKIIIYYIYRNFLSPSCFCTINFTRNFCIKVCYSCYAIIRSMNITSIYERGTLMHEVLWELFDRINVRILASVISQYIWEALYRYTSCRLAFAVC